MRQGSIGRERTWLETNFFIVFEHACVAGNSSKSASKTMFVKAG
jgi:hypothetical protein